MPLDSQSVQSLDSSTNHFPVGVIEGFFGTPWPFRARLKMQKWLANNGYNFFIYAPKNDSALRRNWQQPYTKKWLDAVNCLNKQCHGVGMKFGIGFSPLGATAELFTNLPIIKERINDLLNNISLDYLAILFDDLKIDNIDEGKKQNEILQFVHFLAHSYTQKTKKSLKIITCPSYYSTDLILEKVFGTRPFTYYQDFLQNLPQTTDIFWTGEKVLSTSYSAEHLQEVTELLGRKPFIWDNYPVNDGKKASDFLYFKEFSGREHIISHSSGIAVNPLKQCMLNKIPLATLGCALQSNNENLQKEAFRRAITDNCTRPEAEAIVYYITKLAETPLPEITDDDKNILRHILRSSTSSQLSKEILGFINNQYTFDPNCLTG